jgi:hypothetical protein
MAVSGEIKAVETTSDVALKDNGVPTDLEIAARAYPIPEGIHLMGGANTEAKPAESVGQVLKIGLRRAAKLRTIPFLDGDITISVVSNVDGQPYAGGYHMVDSKKNALTARTITLYDKDEKKVAVCLQGKKTSIGGPVDFSIYGVNPMYDGHKAVTVEGIDGTVYKYMELKDIHMDSNKYDIVSFKNLKPYKNLSFKGCPKNTMSKMNKGVILTTHDEKHPVAMLYQEALISNESKAKGDTTGWDLTIAPGVDPLAVVCITAILEHLRGQNV